MLNVRRTLAAVLALASWSCGSSTEPGAAPEVAAIVVNPSAPTLAINAQLPLQALVQNEAGELVPDASVTWTVENANIASVSAAGVVTGLAIGTTQVAANARGKSGIATVTVQRTPVASVVVLPNPVNVGIGSTTKLTAVAYDAGQNVLPDRGMIWTTSNASVATVDINGLVTAKGKGTALITATAEGKSGSSQFTVSPGAVSRVSVTPNPITMVTGDKQPLSVSAQDANGTSLTVTHVIWASSNTQVATVSGGEVTAVGSGTASITATVDGVPGATSVTVTRAPVGTVSVAPASITVGQKFQMVATVTDTKGNVVTDRVVTWSVPTNVVASINTNTGEVTALLPGTVTVTATSEGKTGSATLTVGLAPVATVAISPASRTIKQNETSQPFNVTLKDAAGNTLTGRAVTWETSDPKVASLLVAPNGSSAQVIGGFAGTATITARSENKSGTATITVTTVAPNKVRLTLQPTSIKEGAQSTATAVVLDGNDLPLQGHTVTWTATGAATIAPATSVTSTGPNSSATATVTGKDVIFTSSANITATSGGKSETKQLTVQP